MIEIKVNDDGCFVACKGTIKEIKMDLCCAVHEILDKLSMQAGRDLDQMYIDYFVMQTAARMAYAEEKAKENASKRGEGSA